MKSKNEFKNRWWIHCNKPWAVGLGSGGFCAPFDWPAGWAGFLWRWFSHGHCAPSWASAGGDMLREKSLVDPLKERLPRIIGVLCLAAVLGGPLAGTAAQTNGTVVAWGANYAGQTNVPAGLSGVIAIAGGGETHSLALKSDSTVVAWGSNGYGQTGQTNVPAGLSNVIAIAGGGYHSLALKSNGKVVAWGDNEFGQTNVPAGLSGIIAIAAGRYHNLALESDSTVVAWGWNSTGQTNVPAGLSNVVAIAGGGYHSLALKSDGTVVAWGDNESGQTNVPTGLSNVIAIAGGEYHSLALRSDGIVIAWGASPGHNYGQADVPAGLSNVVAIAGGSLHSVALKSNGMVVAWSRYNYYGQTNVPMGLGPVVAIAAGEYHSLALCGGHLKMMVAPSNQMAATGCAVEFRVVVLDIPPLFYQWFFDETNAIVGATNPVLHLANAQLSQSGAYTVIVTNTFGSVTSSPAMLSVIDVPPAIVTQPRSQAFWAGFTVDFSAEVAGSLPLSYQWLFNSTRALVGATNSTLELTNVPPWQAGVYSVIVTNAYGAVTSSPAMLSLVPSNTVPMASEAVLRTAIATGLSPVSFACDGTITLSSMITIATNTVLDGSGHQIIISGGNLVRIFEVANNVSFTLIDLTIANGLDTDGFGGGICNFGTLTATNCQFIANCAQGAPGLTGDLGDGDPGHNGYGGAVYNFGTLNIVDCSFAGNSARGGEGGYGSGYIDGPVYEGGAGGDGNGGAICNLGALTMAGCTFSSNSACGGVGGLGGSAGWGSTWPAIDGGAGGMGGDGNGSALFNDGFAGVINSTFALNSGIGGWGGQGGSGSIPIISSEYIGGNGGPGGMGGSGFGVICDNSGQIYLTNCTLAYNSETGGSGGPGGAPGSSRAHSGSSGGAGAAVGSLKTSGGLLVNTLLSANTPSNCSGTITDAGHNLSSDGSCVFTNIGSLNNTNPLLGSLTNNGGPTLTMALLPGSPAIDGGDNAAAPPTDQRGFPRLVGPTIDIGAYEYCYLPVLQISLPQTNAVNVLVYGLPNQSCQLLTSGTLANWLPIATNQISTNGMTMFQDGCNMGQACRFYRVVIP